MSEIEICLGFYYYNQKIWGPYCRRTVGCEL